MVLAGPHVGGGRARTKSPDQSCPSSGTGNLALRQVCGFASEPPPTASGSTSASTSAFRPASRMIYEPIGGQLRSSSRPGVGLRQLARVELDRPPGSGWRACRELDRRSGGGTISRNRKPNGTMFARHSPRASRVLEASSRSLGSFYWPICLGRLSDGAPSSARQRVGKCALVCVGARESARRTRLVKPTTIWNAHSGRAVVVRLEWARDANYIGPRLIFGSGAQGSTTLDVCRSDDRRLCRTIYFDSCPGAFLSSP